MKNGMITFRSITYAQRGLQTLNAAGIYAQMRRTPRQLEQQGCGYCLVLDRKKLTQASDLLRRYGIDYRKVYDEVQEGRL